MCRDVSAAVSVGRGLLASGVLAIVPCNVAWAPATGVATPVRQSAGIAVIVAHEMRDHAVLGVQVAAARGCRVLVDAAYGYADSERTRPLRRADLLPVGSVTKSFTGALAHDLALRGRMAEGATLDAYLPVRAHAASITIAELETQTSGLAEYNTAPSRERLLGESARPVVLDRDLLAFVDSAPLGPRGRWHYSNSNYLLLGRAVEAAAHRPLAKAYERLLRHLGLAPSAVRYGYDVHGAASDGYEFDGYSYRSAPADPVAWASSAGAISATARGLVDFDCALFRERAATMRFAAGSGERSYRWGWFIQRSRRGDVVLYHDGVNGGFRAVNLYVPRLRLAVAAIANTSTFDSRRVGRAILARLSSETPR